MSWTFNHVYVNGLEQFCTLPDTWHWQWPEVLQFSCSDWTFANMTMGSGIRWWPCHFSLSHTTLCLPYFLPDDRLVSGAGGNPGYTADIFGAHRVHPKNDTKCQKDQKVHHTSATHDCCCLSPLPAPFQPKAPPIPRRPPIQVLIRLDPALLLRSDEIGCSQGGMAPGLPVPVWVSRCSGFFLQTKRHAC